MPLSYADIEQARQRLKNVAHLTPVMQSSRINQMLNAQIFFKCENLQRVGAFKFRGAYNSLAMLTDAERAQGVIAYSSGNHAQAVALAAKLFNVKATIVMPQDAPQIKQKATAGYGAEVITFDPKTTTRETVAAKIQEDNPRVLIKPFDHLPVIAGQGTATAEMFEQVGKLDYLLVPCGGGGLLSGSAIAAKHFNPGCKVIGIEPEQADDATRSFRTGQLHQNPNPDTIADGTRTTSLGDYTFPLIREYVDDMVTVSEQAIVNAVACFFDNMKLVVEPSGALPLAAMISQKINLSGRVGALISGGNIDRTTMVKILETAD